MMMLYFAMHSPRNRRNIAARKTVIYSSVLGKKKKQTR
jgi:hypothetical protein